MLAKPPNSVSVVIAERPPLAVEPAKRREGGIVETRAHAEPDHEPRRQKRRQGMRERQGEEADREEPGAHRQHRTAAAPRNGAADPRRDEAGRQQAERQAADHPGQRPARIGDDRRGEHGRQIVARAPGEDLGDAERRDDDGAVRSLCAIGMASAGPLTPPRDIRSRPFLRPLPPHRRRSTHRLWPARGRRNNRRIRRLNDGTRRADAGFRQHEPHVVGRRHVAGDRGGDGADLFIAGQQQEGRRAAIALDADRVEAGLGMRQLAMTMRRHRAAGMQIRIDQRAERLGALEPRIEIETQLARQRQIRTLPGGGDDPIDRSDPARAVGRLALDDDRRRLPRSAATANPVSSVTRPLSTSSLTFAPSSPRAGNWSASPPLKMRARFVLRVAQRTTCAGRSSASARVRAARWRPSGRSRRRASYARIDVPIAAENVGNAIGDPIGEFRFARRRQAARAERIRRRPRAGGVDHRARQVAANASSMSTASTKGRVSRPWLTTLSTPWREIAVTRALVSITAGQLRRCARAVRDSR